MADWKTNLAAAGIVAPPAVWTGLELAQGYSLTVLFFVGAVVFLASGLYLVFGEGLLGGK